MIVINLLVGPVKRGVFGSTFGGCYGLGSIPEDLFAGIDINAPLAEDVFAYTFGFSGLTDPAARINGRYLYEIWPDATYAQVRNMYSGSTELSDYNCIPTAWGGGGKNCLATDPA